MKKFSFFKNNFFASSLAVKPDGMLGVFDSCVSGLPLSNSSGVSSVGSDESCFPLYLVDTFKEQSDTGVFGVGRFHERDIDIIGGAECNLSASCWPDSSVIVSADNVGNVAPTGGFNCRTGSS